MSLHRFLLLIMSCFTVACTTQKLSVSKFTSVDNVIDLKVNLTLPEVRATLGSVPYNVYSNQTDGYAIYTYKYKLVERKVRLNLVNKRGGETAGTEVYAGREHTLFLIFKDGRLESFVTTDGRKDANPLVIMNNTMYTISNDKGKYVIIPLTIQENARQTTNVQNQSKQIVSQDSLVVVSKDMAKTSQTKKIEPPKVKEPKPIVYNPFSPGGLHIGAHTGSLSSAYTSSVPGAYAGIRFGYSFAMNQTLLTGLNYVIQPYMNLFDDISFDLENTAINYVQVPIEYRLDIGKRSIKAYLKAGPRIGYILSGETESGFALTLNSRLDYGFGYGAGVNINILSDLYMSLGFDAYSALKTQDIQYAFFSLTDPLGYRGINLGLTYFISK